MSVPSSVARREAIAQATQRARERLEAFREARTQAVDALLQDLHADIAAELARHATADGQIPPEALVLIELYLDARLQQFETDWRALLLAALQGGAGIGPTAALLTGAAAIGPTERALAFLGEFRAADGLQLSDRLWRVSQQFTDDIAGGIRAGILSGFDAWRTADALTRAGQAIPAELAARIEQGTATALAERLRAAMLDQDGDLRYLLHRILKTETNRAFTEGFIEALRETPDVAGVRFTLSPLHPRFDICDLHAGANLHGLGPGVYPLGQHPYPAHPMTLSYLQPVFIDEVTEADRSGVQSVFDWLRGRSSEEQDAALGGRRKGRAFRAGRLLPDELQTPWYAVAERLGEP